MATKAERFGKTQDKTSDQNRREAGANNANQTLGDFNDLAANIANTVTDNIAAMVEVKVAESMVNGDFQSKIQGRVMERLFGYSQALENSSLVLEAQIAETDARFLLPSQSTEDSNSESKSMEAVA